MSRNRSKEIKFPRHPLFGKKIFRWVPVGKKVSAALSAGYVRVDGVGTVQYKGSKHFKEHTQKLEHGITWLGFFDTSIKSFDGYRWEAAIHKFSSGSGYVVVIRKLRSEGEISDGTIKFFSQPIFISGEFKKKNDAKYHAILWLSMNAYPYQLFKLDGLVTNRSEQYERFTIKERIIISTKLLGFCISKFISLLRFIVSTIIKIFITIVWLPYAAIMLVIGQRSRTWRPKWMPSHKRSPEPNQEKETIQINGQFYERKI